MLGGYWFSNNTANNQGQRMLTDGTWANISDERTKTIHSELKTDSSILQSLAKYKLYSYHYIDTDTPDTPPTLGPTSQSFYGAFGSHLGKSASRHKYNGAFDASGKAVSKCLKAGDEVEMLNSRDEMTAMWLVIKELNAKILQLEDTIERMKNSKL